MPLNLIAPIAAFVSPAVAASGTAPVKLQVISYAQALTATVGGEELKHYAQLTDWL